MGGEKLSQQENIVTELMENSQTELLELTADLISAYVSNNPVPTAELPALIAQVHESLKNLGTAAEEQQPEKLTPAVSVRRSITDDHLVCLEDGKKFKSLKRHLATHHDMTPEEYRAKWNLPADYPMVAPAYAAARSQLAKEMGLGRKRQETPAPAKRARKKPAA